MSLHMNESVLWPTIKELLNNHITDSNETGRLKSWAKVYEADRKSLWKPLSSQVSGHILYVQRWNECGGSCCYSGKICWQEGPLKHLCTSMKSKKEKKPENTQNDGLLAMKPGHAAIGQQPLMQLWRGPLSARFSFIFIFLGCARKHTLTDCDSDRISIISPQSTTAADLN